MKVIRFSYPTFFLSLSHREIIQFQSRGSNRVFGVGGQEGERRTGTCTLCGSASHDRRNCVNRSAGDVFRRCLPSSEKTRHISLPRPSSISGYHVIDLSDCTTLVSMEHDSYVGKPIIKYFKDNASRKRPFSGVCEEAWMEEGCRRYRVRYDDGDMEDLTLGELKKCLVAVEN